LYLAKILHIAKLYLSSALNKYFFWRIKMKKAKRIIVAGAFAIALLIGFSSSAFATLTPCTDAWVACVGDYSNPEVNEACDRGWNACMDALYN
jgi:hypothetical protein